MDFGSILYAAHKNDKTANKEIKCYKTKFEPPKKEVKSTSKLSVNIQNYLKKRDEEEKKKAEEEKRKKEELLVLRSQDRKSYKRVQTMLKRTKSANKSVMEDAIDDVNTAVTMNGPQQCDEDDYGYVSQEASAFYAKLMDKYSSLPPEEPKFPQGKKPVVKDLNAAKDRVRAALQKEEEEEMMPHKRKRKSKSDINEDENGEENGGRGADIQRDPSPEVSKPKKPKKVAPPPMDFSSLLKLAEQKQHEPIAIEKKKVKEVDDGRRPMTNKEKMEYERERERRERQMERQNARKTSHRPPETQNRIPRISEESSSKEKPIGVLGRIPKKTNTNPNIPNSTKLNDGPKRKDSIDSDSTSRNHSAGDRPKSSNISRSASSENNYHSVEKSRNKYQINDDNHKKMPDKNIKPMSSQKEYDRSSKPDSVSISSNKINSRRHDISDEELSDPEYEKPDARNNMFDKQREDRPISSKPQPSKYNEDFNKLHSDRNGFRKRRYSNSDNESEPQSDGSSQRYSSTHKQKPEVKYRPTEKKLLQSDRDAFGNRRNDCSDNDLSDSQSGNYSSKQRYSSNMSYKQKPEIKYKPTEKKSKMSDRETYGNRGHYSNSDNEQSDSQSGNDSYKPRYSNSASHKQTAEVRYRPTEKNTKLSNKESSGKSQYSNSDNDQSDPQSGNDSYKPRYSNSASHKQTAQVRYRPTEKNTKLSNKESSGKSQNSDNDQSDPQSGNDINSHKQRYSSSMKEKLNSEKYAPAEKIPKLPNRDSYYSPDNYDRRSHTHGYSHNDRHGNSFSDSDPEQEKKYVPSKKEHLPKNMSFKTHSRETERRVNRSSSPEDIRYDKLTKNHKMSNNDSELKERRKYEDSKKTVLNKEKKIVSLFKDSNKSHAQEKNRLELKSSKQSLGSDSGRNSGTDSKFKIPKSNSHSESNRTKVLESNEKYKNSELKNNSKSQVSKEKDIKRDSPSFSSKLDKPRCNSKPDIDNHRISIDKNKEKPGATSSSNKSVASKENNKKPTLNAEESLKKNANVWAKPCNLSTPKPTQPGGLSESQLQRLREMNKKPTPSRITPLTENSRLSGSNQGKPSLLKAAAAHAAARAASQKAQSTSREAQKESIERQAPLKKGEKPSSLKPSSPSIQSKSREPSGSDSRMKQRPSNETRPRQFPPSDVKPRQFPPNDLKPRVFPPKDVRPRQFPPPDVKRKPKPRRIEDDSDDEEYDSEMDDFIDDGTDMNQEQISKEIQSIFGYDKSRYTGVDDDDDECMESNFGQIDREEYISLRIGAKEDYEELMKDLAEKERKKKMKKQMMKQRR